MIKKFTKAILGMAMAITIISPSTTAIAEDAVPMSAASAANSPLYSVTVPQEIELGVLKETNYKLVYPITVDLLQSEQGDVYIESPSTFWLKDGDSKVEVNSTLKNNGVMNSKEIESLFWVEPSTVYELTQGDYKGSIDFKFEFRADEYLNTSKGINTSTRNEGMAINGFANVVKGNASGELHKFGVAVATSSGQYLKTAQLNMTKESNGKSENIIKVSDILEVRIGLDGLHTSDNTEYKVDNGDTKKSLTKLSARPTAGNYTDGTYFSTVDAVYVYTSSMLNLGIYQGAMEDGMYPPDFVPEENDTPGTDGNDSNSNGGTDGNGGDSGGSDFEPSITPPTGSDSGTDLDNSGGSDTLVTPDVSSGDGNYTADVSMRKADDINTASMCDSLFYSKADITFKGDNATVTLYVIDPIPLFVDEGTPITNVKYMYKGTTYVASLNASNKVAKYFGTASGFINTAGNYYTSKIVATFPKQAIADSTSGALKVEAYVNAVMKTTQEFYILFGNLTGGSSVSVTDTSDIIDVTDPNYDPYEGLADDSILLGAESFDDASNSLFGAGSLAEALANGLIDFHFSGGTVVTIFMSVVSALVAFFGYAYYLRRKRVMENV